jgi:leucyl-tRNA synthetase
VQPPDDFDGQAYLGDGPAINSDFLDGLHVEEAKAKMIAWLEEHGLGCGKTTYRLRDWLFSRQRYWGEPFPLLHREDGTVVAVPDEDLPVELPEMEDFSPSDDGTAPLARATDWLRATDPETGAPALRETDTMPGWAGSCWYYLRFMDPWNDEAFVAPEVERYWGSVDLYIGGVEHAVLHLLYARFWHKVLYDLGLVTTVEPFQRLFNQGMIQAFAYKDPTGRLIPSDEVDEESDPPLRRADGAPVERIVAKMSKSLRNVVNPDQVIEEHGADTFRLYEMFMGPLADYKPWNTRDVPGSRRFLDRVWRLLVDPESSDPVRPNLTQPTSGEPEGDALVIERALNRALKRVDDSFTALNFNTAVAALMEFLNTATKHGAALRRDQAERLVCALSPFAPHIGEELWHRLGHEGTVSTAPWPAVDARYLVEDEVEVAVQVRGKLRGRVRVPSELDENGVVAAAREEVAAHLEGKEVVKVIYVPGKLVNFVVR